MKNKLDTHNIIIIAHFDNTYLNCIYPATIYFWSIGFENVSLGIHHMTWEISDIINSKLIYHYTKAILAMINNILIAFHSNQKSEKFKTLSNKYIIYS